MSDLIAPLIPNFVLSDTISISNCDKTVSILTKNLTLAVEVLISSLSHSRKQLYCSKTDISSSKSLKLHNWSNFSSYSPKLNPSLAWSSVDTRI